jgi:membrane protein YdbS with pleckstrin-like domain
MGDFQLEDGEEIVLNVREHPLLLFLHLVKYPILAVLPLLLFTVVGFISQASPALSLGLGQSLSFSNGTSRFFVGIYLLFIWMAMFYAIMLHFLNIWIVTTARIIDVHQNGFFRRVVSSFLLVRVQNVTTNVSGVFGTVFGFGTLNVETAGRSEIFEMVGIHDPDEVRDIIMQLVSLLGDGAMDRAFFE